MLEMKSKCESCDTRIEPTSILWALSVIVGFFEFRIH